MPPLWVQTFPSWLSDSASEAPEGDDLGIGQCLLHCAWQSPSEELKLYRTHRGLRSIAGASLTLVWMRMTTTWQKSVATPLISLEDPEPMSVWGTHSGLSADPRQETLPPALRVGFQEPHLKPSPDGERFDSVTLEDLVSSMAWT